MTIWLNGKDGVRIASDSFGDDDNDNDVFADKMLNFLANFPEEFSRIGN